jgi:hypothetical protein
MLIPFSGHLDGPIFSPRRGRSRSAPASIAGVLWLLVAASLSGCGGGSSPAPPAPAATSYSLGISVSGSGTVSSSPAGISSCGSTCSASFAGGTAVTLTALPASGSTFSGWGGACSGSSACTVTMSKAQQVTAGFIAASSYTLSVSVSGAGTVSSSPAGILCSGSCAASFNAATVVTLTALPASGSSFSGWGGACTGSASTCTVTMNQAQQASAGFGGITTAHGLVVPWKIWQSGNVTTPVSGTGATWYVATDGSDSNNGSTAATPFATFAKAYAVLQPGDTVLIRAGLYRQPLNLINGIGGQPGKPITFGAYGDGEVIIDTSPVIPAASWTQVTGSVWRAPLGVQPDAIVVNDVPLKPALAASYTAAASPPPTDPSRVTPGSGLWAYVGGTLTVDFGTSTPATAALVIPAAGNASPVYWYGKDYLVFNGLTARGSGAAGIWGYGSNVMVSQCNSEFNDKAGINFMAMQGNANANNQALYNRVYQNAMLNWPRGNNGYAEAGGGWSGGLAFSFSLNGVARGNLVYANGGEGIISYGSAPATQTGGTLFEQNVSMDNWSVGMYFDNQPNDIARQNIVYFSGYDTASWIHPYDPNVYPWNTLYKFNAGISIGDECNSSGANPCTANLANTQLYDNLIVGYRMGIAEYWEGNAMLTSGSPHGLKNTLIANNTIVMMPTTPPGTYTVGLYLWDNQGANLNSFVYNNLIVGFDNTEPVIWYQGSGADPGVTVDNNAYWNAGFANTFNLGFNTVANDSFAQWRQQSGNDIHGLFGNPVLVNLNALASPANAPYDYRNAQLAAGSPLLGAGIPLDSRFTITLTGATRSGSWNIGAF